MAHSSLMISGQGNSIISVVKKDLLDDFIVNYESAGLAGTEIADIRMKINACKVNK